MLIAFLARFAPYKIFAEIAVFGALAVGVVYEAHQFLEHERGIGRAEVQALWNAQIAKDKDAARLETERLAKQAADAEQNGLTREQTIRTLAAAAGGSNLGLRDTLAAIRSGVPSATIEALGKSVATLSTVLAKCTGQYIDVAERADRHASDAQKLGDAWPTNAPAKP